VLTKDPIWSAVDLEAILANHRAGRKLQNVPSTHHISSLVLKCPVGVCHVDYWSSALLFLRHIDFLDVTAGAKVLDVGTGSGVIPLALSSLTKKKLKILGTDLSPQAVDAAAMNAKNNHIEASFVCGDLFEAVPKASYDLIFFNPPLLNCLPEDNIDKLIFCDPEGKLLSRFVDGVSNHSHNNTIVYLLLSNIGSVTPVTTWNVHKQIVGMELYQSGEIRLLLRISSLI
jgi:methylase of polypeptide subunit release factors